MLASRFLAIIRRAPSSAKVVLIIGLAAYAALITAFIGFYIVVPSENPESLFGPKQSLQFIAIFLIFIGVFYFGLRPLFFSSDIEEIPAVRSRDLSDIRSKLDRLQKEAAINTSDALRVAANELRAEMEKSLAAQSDLTNPENVMIASRRRLLNESLRIDKLSRRNLYFGIVFSGFALAFLAIPLVAQYIFPVDTVATSGDALQWVMQHYIPRFAAGILLQFVGFFFLRLYVANELDIKQNKNEMTNIEMRLAALQLAASASVNSKKQVIEALIKTERNYVLRKNERVISHENLAEFNDLKSVVEKLLEKIPTFRPASEKE